MVLGSILKFLLEQALLVQDKLMKQSALIVVRTKEANKEQYLIPYFIAAHPGCDDDDMLNLSMWLKQHKFKPDQVQTFYPSPMALATSMYYSQRNPLEKVRYKGEKLSVCKDIDKRRLQKAFLRYHDESNWPMLRESLKSLGRADLIGNGPKHLIPPAKTHKYPSIKSKTN